MGLLLKSFTTSRGCLIHNIEGLIVAYPFYTQLCLKNAPTFSLKVVIFNKRTTRLCIFVRQLAVISGYFHINHFIPLDNIFYGIHNTKTNNEKLRF